MSSILSHVAGYPEHFIIVRRARRSFRGSRWRPRRDSGGIRTM